MRVGNDVNTTSSLIARMRTEMDVRVVRYLTLLPLREVFQQKFQDVRTLEQARQARQARKDHT